MSRYTFIVPTIVQFAASDWRDRVTEFFASDTACSLVEIDETPGANAFAYVDVKRGHKARVLREFNNMIRTIDRHHGKRQHPVQIRWNHA